ncbi:hypothetical protein ACFO3J_32285 [Streptomyces polygonati]|uniref:UvrD-like helicase C-terminal domain-containing protein n=1 Tax=Streptomyces polygonati TaxID=1617087 RepID=A0ABV8HWN6_9ACTN
MTKTVVTFLPCSTTQSARRRDSSTVISGSTSGPIDDAEARLAYAAVTRARRHLDCGGLVWIDHHPDGMGRL